MPPTSCRLLAVISATLAIHAVGAATRPRYGGTLRLQLRERIAALDPTAPRLATLIYDRLVRFDDDGRPRPSLAVSWQSTSDAKRWELRVRQGVRFHDGYPLTTAAVAGALERLLSASATVTVSGDSVIVQSNAPQPALLAQLARPAASITARGPDGNLVGTGPFRVTRFDPGRRVTLTAFDDHWGGRPFLDAIEIEMGRANQFLDLQLGKADLVEMAPNEMRAAADRGRKTWSSAPVELAALVFAPGRAGDPKLREALALSLDRAAIHNVLLQRQGEIAGALLPQWLSGYAFVFPAQQDLARARQLLADLPPAARSLALACDPADPLDRIIAERIAVNARDAGLLLQVTTHANADLRLVRVRLASMDPAQALADLASALGLPEPRVAGDPYQAERALLEGFRVVPVFYLPDAWGVGPNVRLWLAPGLTRMGELRLGDLWLESDKP